MMPGIMKRSIASRITLVLTCLISLAVCLSAMLTWLVYVHLQGRMIDDLAQTEAKRLVMRVSRFGDEWTGSFERDMAPSMFVWGESARHPSGTLPAELRHLPVGLHRLERGESTWHVAIADAMDGRLYVLYDSIVIEQPLREFSYALIAIVVGFALLALLVSNAAARWLITPLKDLTDRLTRWVPGSSAALTRHGDEASRLMEVFNRVQDQVDASIADQREFSANLHHEIRTPLTVIRSDAELMLNGSVHDPEQRRARLKRIVRSVREVDDSLESTWSLAHARFEDRDDINLHVCVDDIIENLRLDAEKAALVLVNTVQPEHEATLSHHALMTVMHNIVRNAIAHAAPATLVIESIPDGLQFTDSGPGIDSAELPNIFERYFSNRRADRRLPEQPSGRRRDHAAGSPMNQSGLGLAIAKRVCSMQAWRLDVQSPVSAGRGTRFTLIFREAPR